jgi:UDP-glucose 4-epimerase
MHIVITGGAGFIGSHLIDELLKRQYQVTCLDDLSAGTVANVHHHLSNPRFRFVKLDIEHLSQLLVAGKGCDIVVHLAAKKIPRYSTAYATLTTNADGARAALELARHNRAKFVLASTSDVYGKSAALPFREDADLCIGPSTSRRWAYAVSKLFDEHLTLSYQDEFGLEVVILRFFGAYGERQHLKWWGGPQGVFLEAIAQGAPLEIHGDGLQSRCFIYVGDMAYAVAESLERSSAVGEIINIGTREEISIRDLARLMHQISGAGGEPILQFVPYESLSVNYEDVRRRIPDLTKMRSVLGCEPSMDLETGLQRLWDWYRMAAAARVSTGG